MNLYFTADSKMYDFFKSLTTIWYSIFHRYRRSFFPEYTISRRLNYQIDENQAETQFARSRISRVHISILLIDFPHSLGCVREIHPHIDHRGILYLTRIPPISYIRSHNFTPIKLIKINAVAYTQSPEVKRLASNQVYPLCFRAQKILLTKNLSSLLKKTFDRKTFSLYFF